jgi:hypothetical protein
MFMRAYVAFLAVLFPSSDLPIIFFALFLPPVPMFVSELVVTTYVV